MGIRYLDESKARSKPRLKYLDAKPLQNAEQNQINKLVYLDEKPPSEETISKPRLFYEAAKTAIGKTPIGKAPAFLDKMVEKSKSGLQMLTNLIPKAQYKQQIKEEPPIPTQYQVSGRTKTAGSISPTAQTISGYNIKETITKTIPRGVGRVVSEVAPAFISKEALALAGAGSVIRALRTTPQYKEISKKAVELIPESFKRVFSYRYGQPEKYKEVAEERLLNMFKRREVAEAIGKPIAKLSNQEQKLITRYMKGEIKDIPENLKNYTENARQEFIKIGKEAVDEGLLSQSTYEKNLGKYFPRMFRTKEIKRKNIFAAKPMREDLSRFMKKEDIPEEIRKGMGEILEAGYPTTKGLAQIGQAVETSKMFRKVASNPEWSTIDKDMAFLKGFKRLPEGKKLGQLSGKYVHPEIYNDIQEIFTAPSTFQKVYNNLLNKWKYGKVVLNPATHSRNVMFNTVLLDMGGVDHLEQMRLLPKAANQMIKKGGFYKEAKDIGLLGQEFYGGELNVMRDSLIGEKNWLQWVGKYSGKISDYVTSTKEGLNKLGQIYQGEEQIFKLAKYIKNRELGMGIKEAGRDAAKWLFNYNKLSPATKLLKQSPVGSPFITFTAKVTPRILETIVNNPIKAWKYKVLFNAIEDISQKELNLSDKDKDIIKRNTKGTNVILPFRDDYGSPMILDLSYILPWGDIGEGGGFANLPSVVPPSGFVKTIAELGFNKSLYTDKEIYNSDIDNPKEITQKLLNYTLISLLPSFTPSINVEEDSYFKGGWSWQKIANAIKKRPDEWGRFRDLSYVLLDVFAGIKIFPKDPSELSFYEAKKNEAVKRELVYELKKVLGHKGISEEYKKQKVEQYPTKLERIYENK